ncbi:chloride channel protein [Frankia sp. AgKG'84/4]|uniref:chloride channel protein n=1 Tax=Frankia sp. AgKG'84/4 TaxID=573490 RepID=UPI00200BCC1D|nr:chloride channel protein [Frankia sp. AgKG'84/4]MCL9793650.1 chloride channel protein [Frankia sp. AgKG'84/4]
MRSASVRWAAIRDTDPRWAGAGLAALAVIIGVGVGLGAVAFRWLIKTFTEVFCGRADCSVGGRLPNPHLPGLGFWFLLVAPVLGGLIYGPLINRFAREARGHGVPEVMYAVAERDGRIPPRVSAVKSLASALCIGTGGSVGREGPIVQIGAALGSTLGQLVRVADSRLPILVACGAAGGIAATFNAPIAGVFFALEVILRSFTAEAFGVVVLSAVTASIIGRAAFGTAPFLTLPVFEIRHGGEYLLFIGLGALAGVVGVLFTRLLYLIEDLCDWAWRWPEWLRPAVGGLLLGGVLLALPQMYGVGYPVLERTVHGGYALWFLLILIVGKILATSLTIGIGGSGGVFAPSLFIGAATGAAFGTLAHDLAPTFVAPVGAYALVGMGAVFAGAARAPITAVLILFELTGEYTIILPLMSAVVIATLVSRLLSHDTVYTLKLTRRGIDLTASHEARRLRAIPATRAMRPAPPAIAASTSLTLAAEALARSPHGALPLTDDQDRYQGIITARAIATALDSIVSDSEAVPDPTPGTLPRTVGELCVLPPYVGAATSLAAALHALTSVDSRCLPILDDSGEKAIGWITPQSILAAVYPSSRASAFTTAAPSVMSQPPGESRVPS